MEREVLSPDSFSNTTISSLMLVICSKSIKLPELYLHLVDHTDFPQWKLNYEKLTRCSFSFTSNKHFWLERKKSALVICSCIGNNHKIYGLKQYTFIISVSVSKESVPSVARFCVHSLSGLQTLCSLRCSHWGLEKNSLSSYRQNSFS